MNRPQLARLVDWSGDALRSRKKLQKVAYLLQAAGCPLDAAFTLHHSGPYSHDVASLTDAMVQADLLEEEASPNGAGGRTFSYRLSARARSQLAGIEPSRDGMAAHEGMARRLLRDTSLPALEYGATVAYFRQRGKSWAEARRSAATFKRRPPDGQAMIEAERLAREVLGTGE